jgi:hypothetical protein
MTRRPVPSATVHRAILWCDATTPSHGKTRADRGAGDTLACRFSRVRHRCARRRVQRIEVTHIDRYLGGLSRRGHRATPSTAWTSCARRSGSAGSKA